MDRQEALTLLGKRDSKKVDHNTYLQTREGGKIALRLHATDIVTYNPDGSMTLATGGWQTVTTKDRLNNALRPFAYISQSRGVWSIDVRGETYRFQSGMTIYPDGRVDGQGEDTTKDTNKLKRQIGAYAKACFSNLPLPMPSMGDCFYCQMREVNSNRPLGEAIQDTSHLLMHFEEKYVVPSLVARAYETLGASIVGKHGTFNPEAGDWEKRIAREQGIRIVRRYLYRQFGFAS